MKALHELHIEMPPIGRNVVPAAGLFAAYPKVETFARHFEQMAAVHEPLKRDVAAEALLRDLWQMRSLGHSRLPLLLAIARQHEILLSDEMVTAALAAAEAGFHFERSRSKGGSETAATLLASATDILEWIELSLRRNLARHRDAIGELSPKLFYYSRAALAAAAAAGEEGELLQRRAQHAAAVIMAMVRLDLFSLTPAKQQEIWNSLRALKGRIPAHYIPAKETLMPSGGFWLEWEEGRFADKPAVYKPLRAQDDIGRLVMPLDALLERIDTHLLKPGERTMRMLKNDAMEQTSQQFKKALGQRQRRFERIPCRETLQWSSTWPDLVGMHFLPERVIEMRNVDRGGMMGMVELERPLLPDVDRLIAFRRSNGKLLRALVMWRRLSHQGGNFGASWMGNHLLPATVELFGQTDLSAGKKSWQVLLQPLPEEQLIEGTRLQCWFGDVQMQAGITLLLPQGGRQYTALLERIDYRGGNFCQGVVSLGKPWQRSESRTDMETAP